MRKVSPVWVPGSRQCFPRLTACTSHAGTLPAAWGKGLKSLQALALSNTSISGTLPSEWQYLPALQSLHAEGTRLSGQIPSAWGSRMVNLTAVDLRHTGIKGPFSGSWRKLCSRKHEVGPMADRPPFARTVVFVSGDQV